MPRVYVDGEHRQMDSPFADAYNFVMDRWWPCPADEDGLGSRVLQQLDQIWRVNQHNVGYGIDFIHAILAVKAMGSRDSTFIREALKAIAFGAGIKKP